MMMDRSAGQGGPRPHGERCQGVCVRRGHARQLPEGMVGRTHMGEETRAIRSGEGALTKGEQIPIFWLKDPLMIVWLKDPCG